MTNLIVTKVNSQYMKLNHYACRNSCPRNRWFDQYLLTKAYILIVSVLFLVEPNFVFSQQSVFIRDISIIDVKTGVVIPHQSVEIRDGIIQTLSDTETVTSYDKDAIMVDGRGKYLTPGLIDTHIHFFQTGGLYTRPDIVDFQGEMPYHEEVDFARRIIPDHFQRYLYLGITTVVDVGGPFYNFTIRDSLTQKQVAPNVLVTGPLFSTYQPKALDTDDPSIVQVRTKEAVDSLFNRMLPHQPDLIKVWYIVTADAPAEQTFPLIRYIGERAKQENLPLAVHATEYSTARLAIEAGADILVHSINDSILNENFISLLKKEKVTYVPTLTVNNNYAKVFFC